DLGRAAGALVALVVVGNGLDGFCHCWSPSLTERKRRWRQRRSDGKRAFVIASASEAIRKHETRLDCFVASAPRNDGWPPRLQLVVVRGRLTALLLLVLLARLFLGVVAAVEASGGGAEHAVM